MSVELVHKAPCPQSIFTPKPPGWWRACGCPSGWPKNPDDIEREALEAIRAKAAACRGHRWTPYSAVRGHESRICLLCCVDWSDLKEDRDNG